MGQRSNVPANSNSNQERMTHSHKSPRSAYAHSVTQPSRKVYREQRDSIGYRNGRQSNDERHGDDVDMADADETSHMSGWSSNRNVSNMIAIAKQGNAKFDEFMDEDPQPSPQASQTSYHSRSGRTSRSRVAPVTEEILPPPPAGAVRTRCYRLNLDAPVILSPTHDHLGPMPYQPPAHLLTQRYSRQIYSIPSADSTDERSETQAAIDTARIFRGITVDKNGTILSQNARATRTSKGKDKNKQAASSRQQDKINKAKDLVDEAANLRGGKENDGEKSNMISLVVIGEYDEMKQLVRDGSKKLRDAEGLPDEALLAINRPRISSSSSSRRIIDVTSPSSTSSRKRISSPSSQAYSTTESRDSGSGRLQYMKHHGSSNSMLSSGLPKIKSNPRDKPNSRRLSRNGDNDSETDKRRQHNERGDKCNDMYIFGSGALGLSKGFESIWNCGATGANSPNSTNNTKLRSPKREDHYERRNESNSRYARNGGVSAERDAMVL